MRQKSVLDITLSGWTLAFAAMVVLVTAACVVRADPPPLEEDLPLTINVDRGRTEIENAGAGFGHIVKNGNNPNQGGTGWYRLKLTLISANGVTDSFLSRSAPGSLWRRVAGTKDKWECLDVYCESTFWAVFWAATGGGAGNGHGQGGGGGGGQGSGPLWASVSDIDLDGDSLNWSTESPRRPYGDAGEDKAEFPQGAIADHCTGMLLGANDDNDEGDYDTRDNQNNTLNIATDKTVEPCNLTLKARVRRSGSLVLYDECPGFTRIFRIDEGQFTVVCDPESNLTPDDPAYPVETLQLIGENPRGYYIEGYLKQGQQFEDGIPIEVVSKFTPAGGAEGAAEDRLMATVVRMDIDVDSDNNGAIDSDNTHQEDKYEAKPDLSGMVVPLNSVDSDTPPNGPDNGKTEAGGFDGPGWDVVESGSQNNLKLGKLRRFGDCVVDTIGKHNDIRVAFKVVAGSSGDMSGAVRVFSKDGTAWRVLLDAAQTESTEEMGTGGRQLIDMLKGNDDVDIAIEGLRPGSVYLALELYSLNPSNQHVKVHMDVVKVTVVGFQIDLAGDYIVPRSSQNRVRYSWRYQDSGNPTSMVMKVYNKDNTLVRTITGLPVTYVASQNYAECLWNGCLDDNGTQPLTEAASPYRLELTGMWGQTAHTCGIDNRKVSAWKYAFTIRDREPFAGAGRSGINKDAVAPATLQTTVKLSGRDDETVSHYETKTVDDNDAEVVDGKNVRVTLKLGTGASDWSLVYTTPTNLSLAEDIRYQVIIHRTEDEAATDNAGNIWDMDPDTEDVQDSWDQGEFWIGEDGYMGVACPRP